MNPGDPRAKGRPGMCGGGGGGGGFGAKNLIGDGGYKIQTLWCMYIDGKRLQQSHREQTDEGPSHTHYVLCCVVWWVPLSILPETDDRLLSSPSNLHCIFFSLHSDPRRGPRNPPVLSRLGVRSHRVADDLFSPSPTAQASGVSTSRKRSGGTKFSSLPLIPG